LLHTQRNTNSKDLLQAPSKNLKVIWEEPRSHHSRQRTTTPYSPHSLQWEAPYLPSKLSFPFDDLYRHLIHPSVHRPTYHPKRQPDPVNRFSTVHFPDRETHRQTDRWSRR